MLARKHFDHVAQTVTSTDNDQHAHLLEGLIRWLKPAVCVEIGTNLGGMAIRAPHQGGLAVLLRDFKLGPLRWTEEATPGGMIRPPVPLGSVG